MTTSDPARVLTGIGAVLFDLDGVLTPTAEVHMRAWARLFAPYLAERASQGVDPYTDADYFAHIDGKPRDEGVRTLLTSRGITLPEGDPADPPGTETVRGLGNHKNAEFKAVLAEDGVAAYPGSIQLLDALRSAGTAVAVVSSSKNAPAVLSAVGLADRFSIVVDGAVAAELGLPGKPEPDTFVHAASELGVPVARAAVVEDAVSGVRAGAAGHFGVVIGVDRGAGAEVLREAGADVVVDDLAELLMEVPA